MQADCQAPFGRRRAVRVALVVGLVALVAGACVPPPPPPPPVFDGPVGGARLGLIGHSVPHAALAPLSADLRLSRVAAFDTSNGRTIPEASAAIDWLAASNLEITVIDLGANDLGDRVSQATLRARVVETLDRLAGIRCVVWVDIPEHATPLYNPDWQQEAEAFNNWLPTETAGRSNAHAAPWAAWSEPHPDWMLPDGLHLTALGTQAYAAFVRAQVDEACGGPTAVNPITAGPPVPRAGPPESGDTESAPTTTTTSEPAAAAPDPLPPSTDPQPRTTAGDHPAPPDS